jgi:hypothetical protein
MWRITEVLVRNTHRQDVVVLNRPLNKHSWLEPTERCLLPRSFQDQTVRLVGTRESPPRLHVLRGAEPCRCPSTRAVTYNRGGTVRAREQHKQEQDPTATNVGMLRTVRDHQRHGPLAVRSRQSVAEKRKADRGPQHQPSPPARTSRRLGSASSCSGWRPRRWPRCCHCYCCRRRRTTVQQQLVLDWWCNRSRIGDNAK